MVFICFVGFFSEFSEAQNATITVHMRGVSESKISLLPLTGSNALKPILTAEGIKSGETSTLEVRADDLPKEFVLRFDYKEKVTSTPYPSEKIIIINDQNMELWVNPIYCNNPDSTWFQEGERENSAYFNFLNENARQMKMLGLLQNFLLNYDNPGSSFYKKAIKEYELRRENFNQWLEVQIGLNKDLFVSSLFRFHYIQNIVWKGNELKRKQSLRDNYFEGMDLTDTLILKTSKMKEWMDGYVNLYGELATTTSLRDSLFTLAGKNAIEKAKKGDPLVFGWMVDYFYKGYESFNIEKGIRMLEEYMNDPDCMTTRRQEITRRLEGMKSLVPGNLAPDIIMLDSENNSFILSSYQKDKNSILLLFWSANCSHCQDMVAKIYPWYQQPEVMQKLDIVAISMDETDTEVLAWNRKIQELRGWTHIRAVEGMRGKVAYDYYILSIPVIILVDAKTKNIIALPENTEELDKLLGL